MTQRQSIGPYRLLGPIARGGMAEVYLAKKPGASATEASLRPLFAIKCIRESLASDPRFVRMFAREAKLATLLRHPAIVESYEFGEGGGRYYIAMEYLAGQDLSAIVRRCVATGRRLPVPHAIHIAAAACDALGYAHKLADDQGRALKIVNRDVSPSNIRITYEGRVKMLDFGVAQALTELTSEIGLLKGKLAYMSPEQIRGLPLDNRSDVFSAGIILHELLVGRRLFRDQSEFTLMENVRHQEISKPSQANPRIPERLDEIVMSALRRTPDERYQDAADMAADLRSVLHGYDFEPTELGDLCRSLFAEEYRLEQERHLAPAQSNHFDFTPRGTSTPDSNRNSGQTSATIVERPTTRAVSSPHLPWVWLAAAAVLGLVVLAALFL